MFADRARSRGQRPGLRPQGARLLGPGGRRPPDDHDRPRHRDRSVPGVPAGKRKAASATGKNWLFFGDQQAATDFLYREELHGLQQAGVLTRLDVAFSRDQAEKIYVQTRMLEQGEAFWQWLDEGGHVYVCGDAKRMAVDVDKAAAADRPEVRRPFGGGR